MKVAVIGAGAMGRGIAQVTAAAGHEVIIHDANAEALTAAQEGIAEGFEESVRRAKLTPGSAEDALRRIAFASHLSQLSDVDLVIEAIIEDLIIKQKLFVELEEVVPENALLASNTSSLAIGAIARRMRDRERLIGLHFFNPVPAMKLVEIVVRPESSAALVDTAGTFVASIGKTGIRVMDSPGFLVNLAGRAFVTEALAIVDENVATVDQVDRIARNVLGFPLGPFELMDHTGLDVNFPVTMNVFEANFANPKLRSTWYHRYLYEVGLLGKKSAGGFYRYGQPAPDTVVLPVAASSEPTLPVSIHDPALAELVSPAGLTVVSPPQAELTIVSPLGWDLSTFCKKERLDPTCTVGIDREFTAGDILTLMVPAGVPEEPVHRLSAQLRTAFDVEVINDSPGFVAQRLVAAIVNLGCEIAQRGIASPQDIDTAVTLGLRYPHGPLSWADECGPSTIVEILNGQRESTGDARYAPSAWLLRRARAGISTLTDVHLPARTRQLRPHSSH